MPRQFFKTLIILGPMSICPALFGENQGYAPQVLPENQQAQSYVQSAGGEVQQTNQTVYTSEPTNVVPGVEADGMYPILNAPLYPCPRPNIPTGVGMTHITNPALAPHEMLYPHRNTGLYGPFYHKTTRGWLLTPFGISRREKRVLTGTTVDVKYKGHISPFALFSPSAH